MLHVKVLKRKFEQYFTGSYPTRCMIWRKITRKQNSPKFINSFHFLENSFKLQNYPKKTYLTNVYSFVD